MPSRFDPKIHHRRSIRLKGYDYSQAGAYFVTIVTQGRESFFGAIRNGEMIVNDAGRMVNAVWESMPVRFPNIELGAFIVMPNHFHAIVTIVGAGLVPTPEATVGTGLVPAPENGATTRVAPTSIVTPI
jgi:putative transposase